MERNTMSALIENLFREITCEINTDISISKDGDEWVVSTLEGDTRYSDFFNMVQDMDSTINEWRKEGSLDTVYGDTIEVRSMREAVGAVVALGLMKKPLLLGHGGELYRRVNLVVADDALIVTDDPWEFNYKAIHARECLAPRDIEMWGDSAGYYAMLNCDDVYYLYDTSYDGVLTCYRTADELFMAEDMIFSKEYKHLEPLEKDLYRRLRKAMEDMGAIK